MKKDEFCRGIFAIGQYFTSDKISFCEKFFTTAFTLIYIISPIDLIPDIPIVGWIDDIGVGALFLAYCSWRVNSTNTDDSGSSAHENRDPAQPQIISPSHELPSSDDRDHSKPAPSIFRDRSK